MFQTQFSLLFNINIFGRSINNLKPTTILVKVLPKAMTANKIFFHFLLQRLPCRQMKREQRMVMFPTKINEISLQFRHGFLKVFLFSQDAQSKNLLICHLNLMPASGAISDRI